MSWVLGMLSRQELGAHSRRWHTVAARQAGGRRAGLGSRIDLTRQAMTGLEEEGKVGSYFNICTLYCTVVLYR